MAVWLNPPVLLKAKIKAALIHGVVTFFVGIVSAYFVFIVWYPNDLAEYIGGVGLFSLIMGVELCLGPIMSLIIYNPKKDRNELVRDYIFIGSVQIAALIYGLFTTFESRPVYAVFVIDRIEIISAIELKNDDLTLAAEKFRNLPKFGFQRICVERPTDEKERSDILMSAVTTNRDIELMPKYYRECGGDEVLNAALAGEILVSKLKASGSTESLAGVSEMGDFKWLPVKSRFGAWIEIYPNGKLDDARYLNIDPFAL